MHESIVFCSARTMSSVSKFTFAISSPDEFLVKQLLFKNCAVDFVEICNICTRKVIIKAAKRIFNSNKICRSYCDFYFGVTFL